MKFEASIELNGKTATGIEVPQEVVAGLGDSKRPAVTVTIGGYGYRTTVGRMGGRYLIPVSAEHRAGAGVAAGDVVVVEVEADSAPRRVEIPADLANELDDDSRAFFDGLAPSHRKEWVRWIEEAKKPQTRADRVAKTVLGLQERRSTR